jgi:hypothetical protein
MPDQPRSTEPRSTEPRSTEPRSIGPRPIGPRSKEQRKADTLATLSAAVADVWVATTDGVRPFLVPLTMAWTGERVALATEGTAPTVRNLVAYGRARLALGGTRDVVRIDAVLESTIPVGEATEIGAAYAAQNDWDPREAGPPYVFALLRPERIEAWREENELRDRLLMRDGVWLV